MNKKLISIADRLPTLRKITSSDPKSSILVSAIEEALKAGMLGNYPVGSVITDLNLNIVALGNNESFKPQFRSDAHAEMNAITELEQNHPSRDKSFILFSTLEPCLMCTARVLLSQVSQVIYLQSDLSASIRTTLSHLPANYQDLAKCVSFSEYSPQDELKGIAAELYEVGEQLWNQEYRF